MEDLERMKEENVERGWKDEDRAKQGSRERKSDDERRSAKDHV